MIILIGDDMKPHIYKESPYLRGNWEPAQWDGHGTIEVGLEVFDDWNWRPQDLCDTFELCGFSLIITDDNPFLYECMVESEVTHRLALWKLLRRQEIQLWARYIWANYSSQKGCLPR